MVVVVVLLMFGGVVIDFGVFGVLGVVFGVDVFGLFHASARGRVVFVVRLVWCSPTVLPRGVGRVVAGLLL